jgi:uncharacterized phage protein gp47/JayE
MDWKALVGFKPFEEIVTDALNSLRSSGSRITNLNKGGVFRTLVELAAQGTYDLYGLLVSVAPQGFVVHATGRWLDLHCSGLGLTRFPAQRTRGVVVFGRDRTQGNVTIDAGTIVKTDVSPTGRELRFFTEASAVLPAGQAEITVPVYAEFEGAAHNVGPGYIRRIVTHIDGIDWVTNREGWIIEEGADVETDESLRQRYLARWDELATGATAAGYKAWARSIAGVVDVAVDDRFPRGQGTVDVIITSTAGYPSAELIAEVQAYLETQKPICDNVLVKAPEIAPVDFDLTLYLPPYQGSEAVVEAAALAILQALFVKVDGSAIEPLRIGESLYRAKLTSLLMGIPDVVNVSIAAPASDAVMTPGQLATLGQVQVRVERVSGQ